MNPSWLTWLLCALFGASVARFIHADKLTAPLRTRWEIHFMGRIDELLMRADKLLTLANGKTDPEAIGRLRMEINKRSDAEPGVPFWLTGKKRRQFRPWSTDFREPLDRNAGYAEFISCRWCLPFWIFVGAVLWTWGRVYGFSTDVFEPVRIPLDFALIALVFGLRWVYAMIDLWFGQDH